MANDTTNRVTSVYQYFDERGQLLYVGVTARGVRRAVEHAESKEWWPHATTCALEHYASRHIALKREELLIKRYCPPFNTVHNDKKAESRANLKPTTPNIHADADAVDERLPVTVKNDDRLLVEYRRATEAILAAGVPLKDRRSAYYALPKHLKKIMPCIHCGERPGDRGPECRPCLTSSQAEREAQRLAAS